MAFGVTDLRKGWFCDHSPGKGRIITGSTPPTEHGFLYFEVTCTAASGESKICIGLADAAFNLHRPQVLDVTPGAYTPALDGGAFLAFTNKSGWSGGTATPDTLTSTFTIGDVIGVAVDTGTGHAWWRDATSDPTTWCGSGASPNPVTNTSGYLMSGGAITGAVFVLLGFQYENFGPPPQPFATINFGASAFKAAPPSGFAAWDGTGSTTLNPSDKSSDITLSGGNLIATAPAFIPGANGPASFVRSTTSKT